MDKIENQPDVWRFIKRKMLQAVAILLLILSIPVACQLEAGSTIAGGFWALVSPWTARTKVTFIDKTTKKPVPNLKVKFLWTATYGTCVDTGTIWNYHQQEFFTDASGVIVLPRERKPFPVVFCPIIYRGHLGTSVKVTDDYQPVKRLNGQEDQIIINLQRSQADEEKLQIPNQEAADGHL